MRLKNNFKIVQVVDEYLAIPIMEDSSFHGVVALNAETAFLLRNMVENKSLEELEKLLTQTYDVNSERAKSDIAEMMKKLFKMGLLDDE